MVTTNHWQNQRWQLYGLAPLRIAGLAKHDGKTLRPILQGNIFPAYGDLNEIVLFRLSSNYPCTHQGIRPTAAAVGTWYLTKLCLFETQQSNVCEMLCLQNARGRIDFTVKACYWLRLLVAVTVLKNILAEARWPCSSEIQLLIIQTQRQL